jgi:hypothetical protein
MYHPQNHQKSPNFTKILYTQNFTKIVDMVVQRENHVHCAQKIVPGNITYSKGRRACEAFSILPSRHPSMDGIIQGRKPWQK